jgi:hypothetical protein
MAIYVFNAIYFPIIKNGAKARQARDIYQQ